MGAVVRGIGIYHPDNIVTNADIEKMYDVGGWLARRPATTATRPDPEEG